MTYILIAIAALLGLTVYIMIAGAVWAALRGYRDRHGRTEWVGAVTLGWPVFGPLHLLRSLFAGAFNVGCGFAKAAFIAGQEVAKRRRAAKLPKAQAVKRDKGPLLTLLAIAALGAPHAACDGGGDPIGPECPVIVDAAPDAPTDAFAGYPIGFECDPLVPTGCAPGLTCRIQGPQEGRCLPLGSTGEGDQCTDVAQCAHGMVCLPAELGRWRCKRVCSTNQPQAACGERACQRFWDDAFGYCQ